jgi:hypothetical protein
VDAGIIMIGETEIAVGGDKDFEGNARLMGAGIDIGADESQGEVRDFYTMTITAAPNPCHVGQYSLVTIHVENGPTHQPVVGLRVDVTVEYADANGWYFDADTPGTVLTLTTGWAYTNANGDVKVWVTRTTPGIVTVTGSALQPWGDVLSRSINVLFYDDSGGMPNLVFCIDITGSMSGRPVLSGIVDTVEYLRTMVPGLQVGGVAFRDQLAGTYNLTTNYAAFEAWVNSFSLEGGGDEPEDQLDALWQAADMLHTAGNGGCVALATDSTFHFRDDGSGYTQLIASQVVTKLQDCNCSVFIDHAGLSPDVYTQAGLPVNGSIENALGTYTFPLLRAYMAPGMGMALESPIQDGIFPAGRPN